MDSPATALPSLAGPNWTKVTSTPGRADTTLGACTSHIYCHHLIPRRAEEALPSRSRLKPLLTTLSRNSATKLCALPPPRAGAQAGDTSRGTDGCHFLARGLGGRGFVHSSITRSPPRGMQSWWARASVATQPQAKQHQARGHLPGKVAGGHRAPPGPGEWVPPGTWGRGSAPAAGLTAWLGHHGPLASSLRRATELPPTGYRCQAAAAATEPALQEETRSHYLTAARRSRNPSLTKPSRQIQRLTH